MADFKSSQPSDLRVELRFTGAIAGYNAPLPIFADVLRAIVREFHAVKVEITRTEVVVTVALPHDDLNLEALEERRRQVQDVMDARIRRTTPEG